MLARTQVLNHPNGAGIETPLLVPSFSSKGFGFYRRPPPDGPFVSEVSDVLRLTAPHLNDAMLLSSYDIHHAHLVDAMEFAKIPEILFIDSGGYELRDDDAFTIFSDPFKRKEWNAEMFAQVLDSLMEDRLNAVAIISYDLDSSGSPLREQISSARAFFQKWPNTFHDFLIKPTTADQDYLPIQDVCAHAADLRGFSMLGVTEDELGNSLLLRLKNLAKLRLALQDEGITSPIHVFGSLDPLLTPLYFLAGAEVFDGLSWIRYGYRNGLSIYSQHFGALEPGIQRRGDQIRSEMLIHNLNELDQLRLNMQTFVQTEDFEVFGAHGPFIRKCFDHLRGQVPGVA